VSGLGLPDRLILTPAQAANMTRAKALIDGFPIKVVIADKGYDTRPVVEEIECQGAEAVIPSLKSRPESGNTTGSGTIIGIWRSVPVHGEPAHSSSLSSAAASTVSPRPSTAPCLLPDSSARWLIAKRSPWSRDLPLVGLVGPGLEAGYVINPEINLARGQHDVSEFHLRARCRPISP
jgi:hypothetical protein